MMEGFWFRHFFSSIFISRVNCILINMILRIEFINEKMIITIHKI